MENWIGISPERFAPYRQWQTPAGYLCGTYAAAVLLAYYQDYIDPGIIPTRLRRKNSSSVGSLIDVLRLSIQPLGMPTVALQVAHGLSKYFASQHLPYRARATMVGGWYRAKKRIDQGKPVIVAVIKLKGSTYGNHWVVAYAYLEKEGQRFLKVHDNWGDYEKIIPASWINGTVSLP